MGTRSKKGRRPMPRVRQYVEVTVRFTREGDKWTAECLELGTAAYGDSLEEAQAAIADMISLHLNALEDVHAREAFFKKHRITLHRGAPKATAKRVRVRTGELVERLASPLRLAEAV